MSYRNHRLFVDTVLGLRKCLEDLFWYDEPEKFNPVEKGARQELIKLCHEIAQATEDEYKEILEADRRTELTNGNDCEYNETEPDFLSHGILPSPTIVFHDEYQNKYAIIVSEDVDIYYGIFKKPSLLNLIPMLECDPKGWDFFESILNIPFNFPITSDTGHTINNYYELEGYLEKDVRLSLEQKLKLKERKLIIFHSKNEDQYAICIGVDGKIDVYYLENDPFPERASSTCKGPLPYSIHFDSLADVPFQYPIISNTGHKINNKKELEEYLKINTQV